MLENIYLSKNNPVSFIFLNLSFYDRRIIAFMLAKLTKFFVKHKLVSFRSNVESYYKNSVLTVLTFYDILDILHLYDKFVRLNSSFDFESYVNVIDENMGITLEAPRNFFFGLLIGVSQKNDIYPVASFNNLINVDASFIYLQRYNMYCSIQDTLFNFLLLVEFYILYRVKEILMFLEG